MIIGCSNLEAQNLMIPRASPKATVSQAIGVCTIAVDYGRPSVRNRTIFGDLVPYGKVWRAGANEATVIRFDYPIMIGDKQVEAGTYGLFMIPRNDKWTVILNKDWDQWGAYNYRVEDDIVRIDVIPNSNTHTEICIYSFVEVNKTQAILRMEWENVQIDLKIKTSTGVQTLEEIAKVTSNAQQNWYNFSAAAQYHFYELKEAEKGLEYINVAIALQAPNPAPWMLKSQIYASMGRYEEAIQIAEMAIEVCNKHNFDYEIHENEENIKKWLKKRE